MNTTHVPPQSWYSSVKKRVHNHSQKVTASLEVSKPRNHLLVLDGLRAVACLSVLSYHIYMFNRIYNIWSPSNTIQTLFAIVANFGVSGVILFFLLSGFLLFLPFAKTLLFDGEWPSISRFYLRRFFRILPGYYIALFLVILFFHPEFLHPEYRTQIWQMLTFRMSKALSDQLDGPFWTLAIEFQFYMLLPFIAWGFGLIVRRGRLHWRIIKLSCCLLVMLGWGLLTRYWAYTVTNTPASSFPQLILRALEPYYYGDQGKFFECFAVGMLLAMIYTYTQNVSRGEHLRHKLQRWSSWILLSGLVILGFMATWLYYYATTGQYNPLFAFLYPYTSLINRVYGDWNPIFYTVCYGLCMLGLLYSANWLKKPFEWPVLRWIGLISFSLYMWHIPFLTLFMSSMLPSFQGWNYSIKYISTLAWVFFVIMPVSLTFYRWIEMPGMRLGEMLIQGIQKLKKGPPADVPRNTPAHERTAAVTVPIEAISLPESADVS